MIRFGVSFADYLAIDAVSASSLKALTVSPKHYQHYRAGGARESTPAMRAGTLAHRAILEPSTLGRVVVWDGGRRASKAWDAFCVAHEGAEIVSAPELAQATSIAAAVRREAADYLTVGNSEVTVEWDRDHLDCKGRLDWLAADNTVIVDVKTARAVDSSKFGRQAASLAYHMQAAWYVDGVQSITGVTPKYIIIAVESAAPYDVVCYEVTPDVLDVGRDENQKQVDRLNECLNSDQWPGIGGGCTRTLILPPWAVGDSESDISDLGLEV